MLSSSLRSARFSAALDDDDGFFIFFSFPDFAYSYILVLYIPKSSILMFLTFRTLECRHLAQNREP